MPSPRCGFGFEAVFKNHPRNGVGLVNLSIAADTCGSWKKCPQLPGVRYIQVFIILRLRLEIPMDYTFYGDARVVL